MLNVLVCGGRDYNNGKFILEQLSRLHAERSFNLVIHGAARGADEWAEHWAEVNGVQPVACKALWNKHGKRAGPLRNMAMLKLQPHLVIAFPGGPGTAHMVRIAREAGIPVIELIEPCNERENRKERERRDGQPD